MKRKIIVKDGLLWWDNTKNSENIIGCIEGDAIARANGLVYVERVVTKYKDKGSFYINDNLTIDEED